MEETPLFSVVLWCQSIAGWARYERSTAESIFLGRNVRDEFQEIWAPDSDADSRKTSFFAAVVNLTSTSVCSCNLLMMPLVFERCGIGVSTCLLIYIALVTDHSLVLLCLSARRAGVGTYGNVGQVAFSPMAEKVIFGVLFVFLLLVLIAYYSVLRELVSPVLRYFLGVSESTWILAALLLATSPMAIQRELNRLKYVNFVGILAVLVFVGTLCYANSVEPTDVSDPTTVSPDDKPPVNFRDILSVLPTVVMGFSCSFNALSVQSTLVNPSTDKMDMVIHLSVFIPLVLMCIVGIVGCLYLRKTGSSEDDESFFAQFLLGEGSDETTGMAQLIGRLAICFSVLIGTSLILIPCRDSLLQIVERIVAEHDDHCRGVRESCPDECCEDEDIDDETCMTFPSLPSVPSRWSDQSSGDLYVVNEGTRLLPRIVEESLPKCKVISNPLVHFGSTAAVILLGFGASLINKEITFLWRWVGAVLGIMLAFFLPAACYLKIQERLPSTGIDVWGLVAWSLLLFSVPACISCIFELTLESILG